MVELAFYRAENGRKIFIDWLKTLRDLKAQKAIARRLTRMEAGNFGDCKPVGDGVLELRVDVGAGYRVYYGRQGAEIVLLLCGGNKKTQNKDIKTAIAYWHEWLERQRQ